MRNCSIASDTLDVDDILGLHAYFGGTLERACAPGLSQRLGFLRCEQVDSRTPDSFQRRLGNAADQRFPRLQSQ